MTKLTTSNVNLNINGRNILADINLRLNEQEFTVLIGPNGSGKSSLLKILTGLVKPTQGEIFINNNPISDYSAQALSRERAVLSQSLHLGFPLLNKDVVRMGILDSQTSRADNDLISKAMSYTGAEHLADNYYDQCSGGEQTLIQMARILVQLWTSYHFPRQFLFLDEPTAALDLKFQIKILSLCKQLSLEGMGVFCILHDMQLASHFADRILIMKEGKIVDQGSPEKTLVEGMTLNVFNINSHALVHPLNQKPMLVTSP